MINNVSSKICASVAEKMRDSARQDMALADYRMLDAAHAHAIIAYKGNVPSTNEISKFVTTTFRGKAYASLETARVYANNSAIGVILSAPQITKDLKEAEKLQPVTASTFIDVNDDSEWKIVENPTTHTKYLARALTEDFEQIMAAHKRARSSCPIVTASSSYEKVTANYLLANENDLVKFFSGNSVQCGTIKQVLPGGEDVKVITDEGELFTIPRTYIVEVLRKDPAEQKQIDTDRENFYAKTWGPSYAADLFKNGSKV